MTIETTLFALFVLSLFGNMTLAAFGTMWRSDARTNESLVGLGIKKYAKLEEDKNAEIAAIRAQKAKETMTIDARQLLHDLAAGEAHVRIIPIDPQNIFWRSPR